MDRFDSTEDMSFIAYREYGEGYNARNCGTNVSDCPYPIGSRYARIWNAGWADADMGILSER